MFESLKERWAKIRNDTPGKRFRHQYQRRHDEHGGIGMKMVFIGGGFLIVLAGIFLLPAPGPGMLVIVIGLGLISQESLWMAKLLDKLEVRVRKLIDWTLKTWNEASIYLKSIVIFGVVVVCIAAAAAAYLLFLA